MSTKLACMPLAWPKRRLASLAWWRGQDCQDGHLTCVVSVAAIVDKACLNNSVTLSF
jgi:hypothetical protein